jgi:hypothetical protein
VLASILLVAGCGGSSGRRTRTASTTAVTDTQTAGYAVERSALVTMRQFSPESLLWQEVSLAPDGAGVLTTLIGEVSGATRKDFRLPARQGALMRRLVARARTVAPPARSNPRAELYTLYITGEPSANIQGPARKPLAALIDYLSSLMMNYCC